jgi:hypothetical protein
VPYLILTLILAAIGTIIPGFTKALNWLVLFPIASFAFGTFIWAGITLFTPLDLMSLNSYFTTIALAGIPIGIWITKESLS